MIWKTDVLVIGGGSAGLHAALEARKTGAEVILIQKSGGNTTILSAGGFAGNFCADNIMDQSEINRIFADDILEAGRHINDAKIVGRLVENSVRAIDELKTIGVNFIGSDNGDYKFFQASGHTHPRTVRCVGGHTRQYYATIYKLALASGVIIRNNIDILELIQKEKRVCGAIGIHKDQPIAVLAKGVVLATGGIGSNYSFSTNGSCIRGNGLTMALQVGALLSDMEFIQFMPTTIAFPENLAGHIITDTLRGAGAILLNKHMERFMEKRSPLKKDMETRDKIAMSIFQEVLEGNGTDHGAVYLDARHIDREKIRESFTNYELLMKAGIDPKKTLIEITPAAHYTCGGIKVDQQAFTGIEGLWAAGEVTSGLHGANRLGSVALTENVVYGKLAGKNAALYSENNKLCLENFQFQYDADAAPHDLEIYADISKKLQSILSQYAGIIREESRISEGLEEVKYVQDTINKMEGRQGKTRWNARHIHAKSFSTICFCILKSCLMRRESRGTHFRSDYPAERMDYIGNILIGQKDGTITHTFADTGV